MSDRVTVAVQFSQGRRAAAFQVLAPTVPANLWVMSSELTELEVELLWTLGDWVKVEDVYEHYHQPDINRS